MVKSIKTAFHIIATTIGFHTIATIVEVQNYL